MSSDVRVTFGGDASELRSQVEIAQKAVSGATDDMRRSADSAAPAFEKLQESIDKLNASAERTAQSTRGLLFYQDMAFYMGVARGAGDLLAGTINYVNQKSIDLGTSTRQLIGDVGGLANQFITYAQSQAYMAQFLPLVRVQNDGIVASIGRVVDAYKQQLTYQEIVSKNLVYGSLSAAANAGELDRMNAAATRGGTTTAEFFAGLTSRLTELSHVTPEVASSIVSMFAAIPSSSMVLQYQLTALTTQFASTSDEAKKFSESLAQVMSNPSSGGDAYLRNMQGVSAELMTQFDTAQRANDLNGMRAVILEAYLEKEKALGDLQTQGIRALEAENQKMIERGGIQSAFGNLRNWFHSTEIENAHKQQDALQDQIKKLEEVISRVRNINTSTQQTALNARDIVNSMNPWSTQLETILGKIQTINSAMQGVNRTALDLNGGQASGDATSLIAHFEGMKLNAYWDESKDPSKSTWAIGYGDHTMPNGKAVQQGDSLASADEAFRLLSQRVVEYQNAAIAQIGPAWDKLSKNAQASLTSVTYNYGKGSIPESVANAARTGDSDKVAQALHDLAASRRAAGDSVGANRRDAEGTNASRGDAVSADTSKTIDKSAEATAKLADEAQNARDAMAGGNAVARAQHDILERNAQGQKDSVRDAQELVEAWKKDLENAHQVSAQVAAQNGLRAAQVTLAERINSLAIAKNALEGQDNTTAQKKLDSAKELYALQMKAAGADEALKLAAMQRLKQAQEAFDADSQARAKEALTNRYTLDMQALEEKRSALKNELQSHLITNQGKLDADLALVDKQTAIKVAYLKQMAALENDNTLEQVKAQDKITQAVQEGVTNRQRVITEDNKKIAQSYDQAFRSIGSTITSSIMGMIKGQETFASMMQKIGLQIVEMFIKMGVDSVVGWAASQARMMMQTVTGQSAQTAAVAAGTAARAGILASGAAAGVAAEKVANLSTISGDAAKAAAGAFASTAQIPIIGPALAPGAAAAAFSAVSAFSSFDIGAWSIPHDQLAMVHQNELVMPAAEAGAFRSMLSGAVAGESTGGGGGDSHTHAHFHVTAPDATGVRQFFANNSRHILSALSAGVKNGEHLPLRNLSRLGS